MTDSRPATKKDINALHLKVNKQEDDVRKVKEKMYIHSVKINQVKTDLQDVKDDTVWLRRTITAAIITAVFTGAISFVFYLIQSNL